MKFSLCKFSLVSSFHDDPSQMSTLPGTSKPSIHSVANRFLLPATPFSIPVTGEVISSTGNFPKGHADSSFFSALLVQWTNPSCPIFISTSENSSPERHPSIHSGLNEEMGDQSHYYPLSLTYLAGGTALSALQPNPTSFRSWKAPHSFITPQPPQ